MPKIFYETGAVGKELVSVLVRKDPIEVAEQACEIARLYLEDISPFAVGFIGCENG